MADHLSLAHGLGFSFLYKNGIGHNVDDFFLNSWSNVCDRTQHKRTRKSNHKNLIWLKLLIGQLLDFN